MKKLCIVANISVYVPVPESMTAESYHASITHDDLISLIKNNEVRVYSIEDMEEGDVEEIN